jgi:hypothetical protein
VSNVMSVPGHLRSAPPTTAKTAAAKTATTEAPSPAATATKTASAKTGSTPEATAPEPAAPEATTTEAIAAAEAVREAAEAIVTGTARLRFSIGPRRVTRCATPAARRMLFR